MKLLDPTPPRNSRRVRADALEVGMLIWATSRGSAEVQDIAVGEGEVRLRFRCLWGDMGPWFRTPASTCFVVVPRPLPDEGEDDG